MATSNEVEQYYSTAELAEQLGVKPATLAQWRHRGKAPQATRLNGVVRYSASAVNEWIAAQNAAQNGAQDAAGERAGELVAAGALS